jgi:hypothetical protein
MGSAYIFGPAHPNIYYYIIILYIKQKKYNKKNSEILCDFLVEYSINFDEYWIVFLYYRNTNPVLKYSFFSEMFFLKII